jgi:hypothetical protein
MSMDQRAVIKPVPRAAAHETVAAASHYRLRSAAVRRAGEGRDGALDLAGIAHDAVVSRFSRPAPSIGEADDFKIERQLIFVPGSAPLIGWSRPDTSKSRLIVSA